MFFDCQVILCGDYDDEDPLRKRGMPGNRDRKRGRLETFNPETQSACTTYRALCRLCTVSRNMADGIYHSQKMSQLRKSRKRHFDTHKDEEENLRRVSHSPFATIFYFYPHVRLIRKVSNLFLVSGLRSLHSLQADQ